VILTPAVVAQEGHRLIKAVHAVGRPAWSAALFAPDLIGMGRNRDAYWASRRSLQAYRARRACMAAPRAYAFDREAAIQGAQGRACLEQILTPP
jgi:hypothetical protein